MRQAASQLRQSYTDYSVRFDIAKSYQNALLPLKKSMLDESLLAYNGMLIDVFALLQEGRSQVYAVISTIDAKRDFWLADANLKTALIGLPMSDAMMPETKFESGEAGSAKH
jgi:outer membrane protein TolC